MHRALSVVQSKLVDAGGLAGAPSRVNDEFDFVRTNAVGHACRAGKVEALQLLLSEGVATDVELPALPCWTMQCNLGVAVGKPCQAAPPALHLAAAHGAFECCRALLLHGVDAHLQDRNGTTALAVANQLCKSYFACLRTCPKGCNVWMQQSDFHMHLRKCSAMKRLRAFMSIFGRYATPRRKHLCLPHGVVGHIFGLNGDDLFGKWQVTSVVDMFADSDDPDD